MAILKRIEVWFLLLIVGGVLFWVLRSNGSSQPAGSGASSDAQTGHTSGAPTITGRNLSRDYGNAKLEISFNIHNTSDQPLIIAPPHVQLTDAGGTSLPPFILPFQENTEIPAGKKGEGKQAYWLEEGDLHGQLWLVIGEQRAAVKSDQPFDLESMTNQEAVTFKSEDWNH